MTSNDIKWHQHVQLVSVSGQVLQPKSASTYKDQTSYFSDDLQAGIDAKTLHILYIYKFVVYTIFLFV